MLYVFDVDGTLSFNGTEINEMIIESIKKLEQYSNQIAFASARPIRDLLPIIPAFTDNHLLIDGNGSIVQMKNNTIDVMNPISANSTLLIKQLISKYNLNYLVDDRWNYASKVKANTPIIKQIDPGKLAKRVPLNTITNPSKIILLNIPDRIKNFVANVLTDKKDLSVVEHTGENDIDITSVEINKYSTLRKYTSDKYCAFGNDSNDLELLAHAEKSIWVGGKNKELKKLNLNPDIICRANNFDVANVINNLI